MNPTRPQQKELSRRQVLGGSEGLAPLASLLRRTTLPPLRSAQSPERRARRTRAGRTRAGRTRAGRTKAASLPPLAVIALNRMAFGPRPGDVADFNGLGTTDTERLQNYVDQQLDPASLDDSDLDARILAAGYTTLDKTVPELWAIHVAPNPPYLERMKPIRETERALFLRAMFSKRQLLEVMTEFWHDHFNVYAWESWIGPSFSAFDNLCIRANAFGNFRQLLEEVARSPAMLYYLDNYTSSNAGPNENYSRELFELHGLGAENYLGVMPQNQVPIGADGKPVGYVDPDVYETTRAFTGWTFDFATGEFLYRADWHDRFQKNILGGFLTNDQPALKDGRDVLDLIANHPGTGRFLARKLCRKFISDDPPQSVIDAAAATFNANVTAPNQIELTLRTILLSTEFQTTWAAKSKRPFEIIASALRATAADFNIRLDDSQSDSFMSRIAATGQDPFSHRAPNGYADAQEHWLSTTPLIMTWRMVNWMTSSRDSNDVYMMPILQDTPPNVVTANQLADFWIDRLLNRPLSADERKEVVDFMGAGSNPDLALDLAGDTSVQDRLRSMVGLILLSPEFLWR